MSGKVARAPGGSEETASQCGGLRILVLGFSGQWEAEIATALHEGYGCSQTARALIGAWLDGPAHALVIQYVPGTCHARAGRVEFDPAVPTGVPDKAGSAIMRDEQRAALFHEFTRALAQAAGAETPGCMADDQAISERVLRELGLLSHFARVTQEALALEDLTYEGRWRGTPSCAGSARRAAGSNVVYLPFAATPSVRFSVEMARTSSPLPWLGAALLAAVCVEKELSSDLVSGLQIKLPRLGSGDWL